MIFSTYGVPAEKDEHTLLLLHCDDYSDSSMYGIELMDKSAQVSTEQSKFGGKSMYFNGSTRLSIDDVSAKIFDFGTGDFTVEAWIYPEEITTDNFIFSGSASGAFFFGRKGSNTIGIGRANILWDTEAPIATPANTWSHVAAVRSKGQVSLYVNGNQTGPLANTNAYSMAGFIACIGSRAQTFIIRAIWTKSGYPTWLDGPNPLCRPHSRIGGDKP
mgnify:CR=1 FL=1